MMNNAAVKEEMVVNELKSYFQKYLDLRETGLISQNVILLRVAVNDIKRPENIIVDMSLYDNEEDAMKGANVHRIHNEKLFEKFFGNHAKNDFEDNRDDLWQRVYSTIHRSYFRLFNKYNQIFIEYVINMRLVDTVDDLDK